MAKAVTEEKQETPVIEKAPVLDVEALLNRIALLESQAVKGLEVKEQPREIVHEVETKLEKPRRILYSINAIQDDDAMYDGAYIPGKAVVAKFKFDYELKCDVFGNKYTTGFEYDELEYTSGLQGEELSQYIKDVRVARTWIERVERINLDSNNKQFWSQKHLKMDTLGDVFDTDQSIENLITYYNILGGGYPTIARNYDEAKANSIRLYLSVQEEEEERKHSGRKAYNKAIGILEDIEQEWNRRDALYLMYYLPAVNNKYKGYTMNTPTGTIVNELGDFIEGVDTKMEKKKRPQQFIDAVTTFKNDKKLVQTTATFKAAEYYGFIDYNRKEKLYRNRSTGFEYGNSLKGAVEQLLHPKGSEELAWLIAKINEKWIN